MQERLDSICSLKRGFSDDGVIFQLLPTSKKNKSREEVTATSTLEMQRLRRDKKEKSKANYVDRGVGTLLDGYCNVSELQQYPLIRCIGVKAVVVHLDYQCYI